MAYETKVLNTTFEVNEDLSDEQYKAVVLDSDGKIGLPAEAGQLAVGILQDDPESGEYGSVMTYGLTKAVYGETITAGQEVAVDGNGKMQVATTSDINLGVALSSADADEIGTILLTVGNKSEVSTGEDYSTFDLPIDYSEIDDNVLMDGYEFGFAGSIEKVALITTTETTDTDGGATLTVDIDGVDLDGGVVTFDETDLTLGNVVEGTEVVGDNEFEEDDPITVTSSNTTAIDDGAGVLVLTLKTEFDVE